jgi:large subunit ribosomal protein L21
MSYAVIKTGGKQYRVSQGSVIDVEKLAGEAGSTATFSEVLFFVDGDQSKFGQDLANASVTAEVVEHFKGDKVLAYKYRRRKGYHRTVGHRRQLTRLKITGITA